MRQLCIGQVMAATGDDRHNVVDGRLKEAVAPEIRIDRGDAQRAYPAIAAGDVQHREAQPEGRPAFPRLLPQGRRRTEPPVVADAARRGAVDLPVVGRPKCRVAVAASTLLARQAALLVQLRAAGRAVADPDVRVGHSRIALRASTLRQPSRCRVAVERPPVSAATRTHRPRSAYPLIRGKRGAAHWATHSRILARRTDTYVSAR
jgi:hypothetical protein